MDPLEARQLFAVSFAAPVLTALPAMGTAIVAGHFDSSAQTDIAVVAGDQTQLFGGNADGSFSSTASIPLPADNGSRIQTVNLLSADLNHDGFDDSQLAAPAGTVLFFDGTMQLASVPISAQGVATFSMQIHPPSLGGEMNRF